MDSTACKTRGPTWAACPRLLPYLGATSLYFITVRPLFHMHINAMRNLASLIVAGAVLLAQHAAADVEPSLSGASPGSAVHHLKLHKRAKSVLRYAHGVPGEHASFSANAGPSDFQGKAGRNLRLATSSLGDDDAQERQAGSIAAPKVIPLRDTSGMVYCAEVGYGTPAQYVHLQVDTGSSDVWFFNQSVESNSPSNPPHLYVDTAASTSWVPAHRTVELHYGTGPVSLAQGLDTVTVGSVSVQAVPLGIYASTAQNDPWLRLALDGILGLSFPSLAQITTPTWLQRSGVSSMFSFLLSGHRAELDSYMTLGSVNSSFWRGPLYWSPILESNSGEFEEWRVGIWHATRSGVVNFPQKDYCGSASSYDDPGCQGLVDTGTSFLLMPEDAYNDFVEALTAAWDAQLQSASAGPGGALAAIAAALRVEPSARLDAAASQVELAQVHAGGIDFNLLPNITLTISVLKSGHAWTQDEGELKLVDYTLTAWQYMSCVDDPAQVTCTPRISKIPAAPLGASWILGDTWLSTFSPTFDMSNGLVGMAASVYSSVDEPQPSSYTLPTLPWWRSTMFWIIAVASVTLLTVGTCVVLKLRKQARQAQATHLLSPAAAPYGVDESIVYGTASPVSYQYTPLPAGPPIVEGTATFGNWGKEWPAHSPGQY